MKKEIQSSQNKYIRYCLLLDKIAHISEKDFETMKSLPINEILNQCINSIVFKYFYEQCSHYLYKTFVNTTKFGLSSRNSYRKIKQPFRKTSIGQNSLSLIAPSLWNKITEEINRTTSLNILKHNLKKAIWRELESVIIINYCYYYCS